MTLASETDLNIGEQATTLDAADLRDIRGSLDGDGEAYARIVARHQQTIAARMWKFTRDRGTLEQLVHDVFVEAYLHLSSYRGRAPLIHWLTRIATRTGYRHWRGEARRRETAPLDPGNCDVAMESGGQDAHDAAELVHALLERLPPRDRLVLTLQYLEECSVREIAQQTGWSVAMVKVQAHRARETQKTYRGDRTMNEPLNRNDPLERFAELAARACQSEVPAVDVTASVRAAVREVTLSVPGDRTLLVTAMLAALAASVVGVLSFDLVSAINDPVAALFSPLTMVLQ